MTNIPGPQLPLYLLGRELRDLFPIAFLPDHHALAIAIMSYNGALDYGLLGDYDALADIDVIVRGLEESRDELLAAARGKRGSGSGARRAGAPARSGSARGGSAREGSAREGSAREGSARGGSARGSARASSARNGRSGTTPSIIPSSSSRPQQGPAADMRAKRASRKPPRE